MTPHSQGNPEHGATRRKRGKLCALPIPTPLPASPYSGFPKECGAVKVGMGFSTVEEWSMLPHSWWFPVPTTPKPLPSPPSPVPWAQCTASYLPWQSNSLYPLCFFHNFPESSPQQPDTFLPAVWAATPASVSYCLLDHRWRN